ncbi:MAG: CRISPR system precrRNA processing endoribonuclease RAMP protein Cas6 [Propionibacteriaceae bacterium]|nr:CRISPR system precrRNA processing endoribonuclease RAMP protein Cas6 [Propionibacteriaceae bacterium]
MGSALIAAGGGLPPAPIRLLPHRGEVAPSNRNALPQGRVRRWEVTLKTVPDQEHSLSPSPAGIHSLISSWLHSSALDPVGEPHHGPHSCTVRWRRSSPDTVTIVVHVFREELSAVLVRRLFLGRAERLGQVAVLVTGLKELGSTALLSLSGRPSRQWRLRFPAGVTFKRGDVFMPWPAPDAVLGSIRRRLAETWGWEPDAASMRNAIRAVAPTRAEITTRRWREGRNGRGRDVALAVGEVEWVATGDEETRTFIDLLLQAGELIGVGAKTTWGAGVLEITHPGFATPPNRVVPG